MLNHRQAVSVAKNLEMLESLTRAGMQNSGAASLVRHIITRKLREAFGRTITFDCFGFPIGLKVAEWDALMTGRELLYRERLAVKAAKEMQERERVTRATVEASAFAAGVTA